jgi:hypothetical protein
VVVVVPALQCSTSEEVEVEGEGEGEVGVGLGPQGVFDVGGGEAGLELLDPCLVLVFERGFRSGIAVLWWRGLCDRGGGWWVQGLGGERSDVGMEEKGGWGCGEWT